MKKFFLLPAFLMYAAFLFAQPDSITTRDERTIKYKIRKNLIPDFEKVLVFIADSSTGPNEVEEVIRSRTQGTPESKIFTDDKVTIESDLVPGADTTKTVGGDLQIIQYLNSFNTNYAKTEDKNISLNNIEISPLKKADYLYYNVKFECDYRGTTTAGEKFYKFNRVAEVKLVNDHGWIPYINSIRFAKGGELDTVTNIFKNVIKSETDIDKIMDEIESKEEERIREENNKITALIEDGNDLFDKKDFEGALKKFKDARKINIYNTDPLPLIEKAKQAIRKADEERLAKEERDRHVAELKKEVFRLRDNYDFQNAKLLCDSLIRDYNVNDNEYTSLNSDLSEINASLTGIEISIEHRNLKEAVRNCEGKIAQAKKDTYRAEFCYRMALIYYTLDKSETNKIYEFLRQAIDYSLRHHQNALKMRADMYMADSDILHAIEDASQLINNESRNPENYIFRAELYKKDGKYPKAIDDYGKAISYNTPDTTAYVEKSTLEYNNLKFSEAKKTATDGIQKTICYGMLYFNRGIANDKLNEFNAAGEDFLKAKQCGLEEKQKTWIVSISENYVARGKTNFTKGALYDARNQFSNAILIDSNLNALYERARTYILLSRNDSAITDLDKLIRRKPDFRDAHSQRAVAYSNLQNFEKANEDFADEIKRFSDNADAWYAKGSSEIVQAKFAEAAASFERSATWHPTDSTWYKASYSHYYNQNYNKAIETSIKARELNEKMWQVYYISGRAFYDTKQLKDAIKEFEKAYKIENRNEDLIFAYAQALEANSNFLSASQTYDRLSTSERFKDTTIFRSGICLVKTRDKENYAIAANKFDRYIINSNNPDKSEVFAWAAYAHLSNDLSKNADEFIGKSENANPNNSMLQFVLACRNVRNNMYDDAFLNLEKAIPALKLQRSDLDDEPLLR
ncbi:MAG TPA: tetratricopeptide repeat protein, partial [Bacteroidia bacterium]|nr:tetratricopeptide repeat protein [Bacteroidia bacterium]